MSNHPVDTFDLQTLVAGTCTEHDRKRIHDHAQGCAHCQSQLEALNRDKQEFLKNLPFDSVNIVRFPHQERNTRKQLYSLAACLILLLGGGMFLFTRSGTLRAKGGVSLHIFVLSDGGRAISRNNNAYLPGERIQFSYSCGSENHFALLSFDQNGRSTVFYPQSGDTSLLLEKGRNVPLPHSILLDDYVGKELYVAIFSKKPFLVQTVKATIEKSIENSGDWTNLRISLPGMIVRTELITKLPLNPIHNDSGT